MRASTGRVPTEEARMLEMASTTRRYHILRLAAPGLLMYILIIVLSNRAEPASLGIAQIVIGVVAFGVAFWGVAGKEQPQTERVSLSAMVTLAAALVTTGIFIWASGPLHHELGLPTLAALFLLLVPLIIAGILGDMWQVIATALLTCGFSLALLLLMPLSSDLQRLFQAHHELVVVLALPIIAQAGAAFMLLAGASGAGYIQQMMVDWRMAYLHVREVDRMREEFIASINHELRNPIMAVQNYLMLANLLGERGDIEAQRQMLQRGAEVADHLGGLMESIMSIRRLRTAQKDVPLLPVALRAIAERTANVVALVDNNGPHQIIIQIDGNLTVLGNDGLLNETLSNLLTNAAKYSPPNTTITVAARIITPRELARLRPQFETQRGNGYVELTVRDQGMGIPVDKAPLIFEPFVRLGRDETSTRIGSGMGLAIARSNVTSMGGDIWVESDGIAGHGTTLHIILNIVVDDTRPTGTPTQKRLGGPANDTNGSGA